jgi:hypothetical protein
MKAIIWIILLAGLPTLQAQSAGDFLAQVKDVPLPGKPTRCDYVSLDEQSGRLYFSHMSDGDLVVFDTKPIPLSRICRAFP